MPSPKLPLLTSVVIRHRDGARCVYCGASPKIGATMVVDHLRPRVWGGTDDAWNLVTCCTGCNTIKGTMNLAAFVLMIDQCRDGLQDPHWARMAGRTSESIRASVQAAIVRPLDYEAAARILEEEKQARRRR